TTPSPTRSAPHRAGRRRGRQDLRARAATREEVLAAAKGEAADKAIAEGARPDSVQIVEVDEVPIAYLPGNAVRVRIKAVGDLQLTAGPPPRGADNAPEDPPSGPVRWPRATIPLCRAAARTHTHDPQP